MKKLTLFPILLLFLISCTSSPVGNDTISQGRRSMSGKVILDANSSPENIFVWLEEFNISTMTDAEGDFSLTLPPSGSQNATGGASGVFRVYFYVANYSLKVSELLVQDGEFMYGKADLDNDGKLITSVSLEKFLDIKSEVRPASVPRSFGERVSAEVELRSLSDSVSVVFPNSIGGFLGAVFLRNIESGQVYVLRGPEGNNDKVVVTRTGMSRQLVFDLAGPAGGSLSVGKYEVIPYILVAHEPVPPQLIESLGNNVEALTGNYLKIPFRRESAIFEIE